MTPTRRTATDRTSSDRTTTHRPATRAAAGTAALVLTLTLAACGTAQDAEAPDATGTATERAAAVNNAADTRFAQMMVIHHEGAIEMADLAVQQAGSQEVRALAERISAAQGPEIDLMTGWLEEWGEDMPHDADMGGMDHGGMDMGGMDQEQAMDELRGLTGADFDRRFLELMIEHHRGAMEMSQTHMTEGEHPEAATLAEAIVADQEAEITEMEDLLRASRG